MNFFNFTEEKTTLEFSESNGLWTKNPYYQFQNTLKYDDEKLILEKFTILEKERSKVSYNWLQCYSIETITTLFKNNGFEIIEKYSNVAGKLFI